MKNIKCEKCDIMFECEEMLVYCKNFCIKCNRLNIEDIHSINCINCEEFYQASNEIQELWSYIWNKSINEKGLRWYKKVRDKFIKILDKKKEKKEKKIRTKENLLLKKYKFDKLEVK